MNQIISEEAQWPTWRGILELVKEHSNRRKLISEKLLRERLPSYRETAEHLAALVAGHRPATEQSQPHDEETDEFYF